jgi:hypothetical protein
LLPLPYLNLYLLHFFLPCSFCLSSPFFLSIIVLYLCFFPSKICNYRKTWKESFATYSIIWMFSIRSAPIQIECTQEKCVLYNTDKEIRTVKDSQLKKSCQFYTICSYHIFIWIYFTSNIKWKTVSLIRKQPWIKKTNNITWTSHWYIVIEITSISVYANLMVLCNSAYPTDLN